jgi:hypothetical protein
MIQLRKKNLVWLFPYTIFLVTLSQIIPHYQYKTLIEDTNKFIRDEIKDEKILSIHELPYTPGKGTYKTMQIANGKIYPLFLKNPDREDNIRPEAIINKEANENTFQINSESTILKFEIQSLEGQKKFMRIYLFAANSSSFSKLSNAHPFSVSVVLFGCRILKDFKYP